MKAIITRKNYSEKQVTGTFILLDEKGKQVFECKTLELPDKNNARRVSCIPKGNYPVLYRYTPKRKGHYLVNNVPYRDLILIHTGNYNADILGCILVGDSLVDINKDNYKDVVNSRKTLDAILKLAPKGFDMQVK